MVSNRVTIPVVLAAGVIVNLWALPLPAGSSGPAIGDEAPDFELPGSDGKIYNLADYRGEKVVVLAWFPKAFTGG